MYENSQSELYRSAGVDITAGYRAVELMKEHIGRTNIPGVVSDIGGFGGLFMPDLSGMKAPVLVSGTDGVGTKLKLAFVMDRHDTVGIDCVAMCVNDIICCGAKPLFFLDYIAVGKNIPEKVAAIVSGVAEGCVQARCALIGGETAEMPGFYPEDEYDLAGFAVGIADRDRMLSPDRVSEGDVIIALPSSGVHSNGFSLVRKLIPPTKERLGEYVGELSETLGDALLKPTRIYVRQITSLLDAGIKLGCISHITGGGFYENIPRALPEGLCAKIDRQSIRVLPVFDILSRLADADEKQMFNTFNMGVGMCIILPKDEADRALAVLAEQGEDAYIIGEAVKGENGVIIC